MQSVLRARLESAFGERVPLPFTDLGQRACERVPAGIALLDAETGGLPRGAITEIFGPPSSGRTSAMMSILAEATAGGEVCALIDGADALDPKSAEAAGVDLNRLLWVRCRKLGQVLKSTDLVLQSGGFGRVVMDVADLPLPDVRAIPLGTWFRFQRAIEKTPAVLLVMSREPAVHSAAAIALRVERRGAEWSTVLDGVQSDIEACSRQGKSHVRVHLRSECIR